MQCTRCYKLRGAAAPVAPALKEGLLTHVLTHASSTGSTDNVCPTKFVQPIKAAWLIQPRYGAFNVQSMNEGTKLDLPSRPFTRPFHITMALFQLHQIIKMKRCWSLINLRIAVTLSFSEKIFLHVNGTYLAVTLHSLRAMAQNFRPK